MKASDFFAALVHFFNDFIGAVAPGFLLIGGLYWLFGLPQIQEHPQLVLNTGLIWIIALIVAFTAGHGLLSLHRIISAWIGRLMFAIFGLITTCEWDHRSMSERIQASEAYKAFQAHVQGRIGNGSIDGKKMTFNDLRSVAMAISPDAAELGRRFMFISLFCYGISMSILVLLTSFIFGRLSTLKWLDVAIPFGVFILFYMRGLEFEYRALNTPFPTALTSIAFESANESRQES